MTGTVGDLVLAPYHEDQVINITGSPCILASSLQGKLDQLQDPEEHEFGLPILSHGRTVGHILAAALQNALNGLEDPRFTLCLLSSEAPSYPQEEAAWNGYMVDFTPYVKQLTFTFEANTKQAFAYDCFRKLELDYLYIVRNGKYMGLVSSSCSLRSHVVLSALQR